MNRICLFLVVISLTTGGLVYAAQQELTVCSFGGTYNDGLDKIFGKPFTEATGIKVNFTSLPTFAKIESQVKSGNIEWDIVECEARMFARGSRAGMFEPLDLSKIPVQDFVEGSVKKDGLGLCFYSFNICYNTDKWAPGTGPSSLRDFWDVVKFPGPRSVYYSPLSSLEAALRADGVAWDKVYPIDVERAFKKLNELKPELRVYYKSGGQAQQIVQNKEADVGYYPGGRMLQAAAEGAPVYVEWNDQLVDLDYWAIPKGCKNYDAAAKLMAFMSDPARQAAFADWTYYGPANRKAFDHIDRQKAAMMPTSAENLAKGRIVDESWYADHEEEVEKRWEAWKME